MILRDISLFSFCLLIDSACCLLNFAKELFISNILSSDVSSITIKQRILTNMESIYYLQSFDRMVIYFILNLIYLITQLCITFSYYPVGILAIPYVQNKIIKNLKI